MSEDLFLYLVPIFGALLGSFSNVVIHRLPQGLSVAWPGSRCPKCGTPIRWFDNIPILGWLLLLGRCRACKKSIHWRYPLVESLMAALFFFIYYQFGWSWTTLEYFIFTFGLVTVTFIDFDHMILPDVFTLSGIVLGLVGAFLNPERTFFPAFLGVVVGGGFLWAVAEAYFRLKKVEGMGGGDIKLIAWIGAYLGIESILPVIIFSSFLGAFVGITLMVVKKKGFQSEIPFGPYLAGAALVFMFYPDLDPVFFLK